MRADTIRLISNVILVPIVRRLLTIAVWLGRILMGQKQGERRTLGLALKKRSWATRSNPPSAEDFLMNRITFDAESRPFIRNTGIGLWQLVGWISSGQSEGDVLSRHPELEPADFPDAYHWAKFLTAVLGLDDRMKRLREEVRAKFEVAEN